VGNLTPIDLRHHLSLSGVIVKQTNIIYTMMMMMMIYTKAERFVQLWCSSV